METSETTHVIVTGIVQGVGYRAWTADTARRHGLSGWVRNRRDGSVEAVFSGPSDAVRAMLADCLSGPPSAEVTSVKTAGWSEAHAGGFHVLPTA
jgi:acylphosphatase